MAKKRYRWLKLSEDFFKDKRMKKLRKIAGGETFTIIYLKMQLLSLRDEGKLFFEGVEENFAEEVALEIDETVENVKLTIAFLLSNGLLIEEDEDAYTLPQTVASIGSESESAERVRRHRKKKAIAPPEPTSGALHCNGGALHCNTDVTKCNTEKEKEKEKEIEIDKEREGEDGGKPPTHAPKHKYGEYNNVRLTDEEVNKLNTEYGDSTVKACITFLDEYIEMKGYKAKSHYLAIRKWVVDAVHERRTKKDPLAESYRMMEEWAKGGNNGTDGLFKDW